uniref:Uncharacterized protein n=1 Tax=Ananas comosus var. bracteatus TaxID=296719 RepID=A0A6V7Q362_ANACO|nr:unnamed protein product [Ananas comosus var. bracteatus]
MMRNLSRRREVSPPPPPTRLLSWLAVAVLVHSALLLRSAVLTEGARAGTSSVFLDLARSQCLRQRPIVRAAPAAVGSETSSSVTIRGAYPPARILFTTDDDDDDELYIAYGARLLQYPWRDHEIAAVPKTTLFLFFFFFFFFFIYASLNLLSSSSSSSPAAAAAAAVAVGVVGGGDGDDDGDGGAAVMRASFAVEGDVAWAVQVSDLHVSAHHPARARDLVRLLAPALRLLRPSLLLITGDLTDAKNKKRTSTRQDEYEWILYRNSMDEVVKQSGLDKHRIFDIRGNHDKYGVPFVGHKMDFFSTHSINSQLNRLSTIYSISLLGNDRRYLFIGIDDTMSIGIRGPSNLFGHPTDKRIDVVESELQYWDNSTALITKVVFGHFPMSFTASSKTGTRYENVFLGSRFLHIFAVTCMQSSVRSFGGFIRLRQLLILEIERGCITFGVGTCGVSSLADQNALVLGYATSEEGEIAVMYLSGWKIKAPNNPVVVDKLASPDIMVIALPVIKILLFLCMTITLVHFKICTALMWAYGAAPVALSPALCWVPPLLLVAAVYSTATTAE